MQLTRAGEYAVKSLLYLAAQPADTRVQAGEVAGAAAIPLTFARKILESLAKTGLVRSYRGAGGGFTLGRAPAQITVLQVVEAVEGPLALNQCRSPQPCAQLDGCAMSGVWLEAQRAVETVLSRYTLADVARPRG